MTRLIDADALKIEIACLHGSDYQTIHYLNHAPTVDAVQVIRCKDCKHFDTDTGKKGYYFCPMLDTFRRPEGYCDLAERKEE